MTRKASPKPTPQPRSRAATEAPAAVVGMPFDAVGDFSGLAAEWQRLFTQALRDVGQQARLERSEEGEARWPMQMWALQSEMYAAQAARLTKLFEEALAAALDLQSRWFKQFEAAGLLAAQNWWPGAGKTEAVTGSPFAAWSEFGNTMLAAMRNDVETRPQR